MAEKPKSVVDLLEERAQLKAHLWRFRLWPRQWAAYNLTVPFEWQIYPFQRDQLSNIPGHPGIYSLVIQPSIALHSECSYLMYIGKAEDTLRERFRKYFYERDDPLARPKILELLNLYEGYVHFYCSTIEQRERIKEIEDALINAFLPPCNTDLPAETSHIAGAFS